jgi:hypothetical protein
VIVELRWSRRSSTWLLRFRSDVHVSSLGRWFDTGVSWARRSGAPPPRIVWRIVRDYGERTEILAESKWRRRRLRWRSRCDCTCISCDDREPGDELPCVYGFPFWENLDTGPTSALIWGRGRFRP